MGSRVIKLCGNRKCISFYHHRRTTGQECLSQKVKKCEKSEKISEKYLQRVQQIINDLNLEIFVDHFSLKSNFIDWKTQIVIIFKKFF